MSTADVMNAAESSKSPTSTEDFTFYSILSSSEHKWSCQSNQRVQCFAVLGQSIRGPSWLLTGSLPTDTQLLAAHIKGLWEWKKRSRTFRQSLISNCRKLEQTGSIQLSRHHRERHSYMHTQTDAQERLHDHRQANSLTCARPQGAHYWDWLQDLLLMRTRLYCVAFAS